MKDKYKIINVITTGGMATIYKGEQISLSRPVIIKKLHPHLASDKELVKRFEREAKILGRLNHKNIVEVIDFFKKEGDYFIVLEYIEGSSLKELIEQVGILPLNIAIFILSEIALGIAAAHKKGILHRDIKPENIMVSKDGRIKVSDFGLASLLEGVEITEPGSTIGTPAYLAPELIRGQKASRSSDIYSLGLVFYELLTGINPFRGKNRFETINRRLYKRLPITHLAKNIENKAIIKILAKMTKSDSKNRYSNIETILKDLLPYNTSSPKEFVQFLSYPHNRKHIKEEENNLKVTGIVVYSSLLLIVIIIFFGIIIGNRRIRSSNVNSFSIPVKTKVREKPKNDTLFVNNFIKQEAPPVMTNIKKIDSGLTPTLTEKSCGFIKLVVKPWAKIFIDDVFYASTPLSKPIKLNVGEHLLRFKHPNRKEFSETVTIAKNETLKINITLEEINGYLKINVNPWAEIYLDGKKKGTTPIAKPILLSSGEHILELKKGKSVLWHQTINIPVEDTLRKTINLE